MKKVFLFCLAAWMTGGPWSVRAEAAGAGAWSPRTESAERSLLATVSCLWKDGSLPVRLENAATGEAVELSLVPKKGAQLAKGSFAPRAFEPTPFAAPEGEWIELAWRRLPDGWTLFVDRHPAARFPEPWEGSVRLCTPADRLPPDEMGAPSDYQQRLGSFRFEDAFMVPEDTADPLRNWEILAGDWRMHTVTGTVSGAVAKAKLGRQPTAAHSPNFYSLEGRGEHASIVAGETFYCNYRMKAALHHDGGTNGIVFLVGGDLRAYGFTCRDNPEDGCLAFDLWRGRLDDSAAPRETLRSVATDLLPGQWYALEARVFPGRIDCLVDGVAVFSYEGALPPGGQFGLFQDGGDGARFDDVAAGTHGDLLLDGPGDLAFQTLAATARVRAHAGLPNKTPPPRDTPFATASHLSLAAEKGTEGIWVAGSTADPARRFETVFTPDSGCTAFGLLAGWTGPDAPCWRLGVERGPDALVVRLAFGGETVDEHRLPASGAKNFHLVLDATEDGGIAGFLDGERLVMASVRGPVEGACGLWVGAGTGTRALLPLARASVPVYRDRFEKNPSFVRDLFMKNWASPEGQWLQVADGNAWFRSDFLGRIDVSLPFADPMELHLAVPEPEHKEGEDFAPPPPAPGAPIVAPTPEALPGACQVAVRDGTVVLRATDAAGAPLAEVSFPLEAIPNAHFAAEGAVAAADHRIATAHLDGRLFWVDCSTGLLARVHLPGRPGGRRVRVTGLSIDHLRRTRVVRDHVVDCLFNESLAAWTINGGRWEVVNRFQCEPSWSHMNGENADSLAALWSKMEVGGDFSMEFYAGNRHGWYDRIGDFNLTVCSRKGATGDGYSVICTGWDPDSSQLRTRLLRDGETQAVSDRYLAPRFRSGNARLVVEPLVAAGRDVHGAWYAMRLRRLGARLEYFFDNVPVFAWEDPDPIASGLFGIWTYRNSMMVSRVRILAEEIRPRRFGMRELPADAAATKAPSRKTPPAAVPSGITNVLASTWPVEMLDPSLWVAADPVSRPRLSFAADRDGRPTMRVEASLGGGEFSVRSTLPPKPLHTILGWSFEVARHPKARPELGFALCEASGITNALYSFPLGGGFETRGPRRLAGSADVPATPEGAKERVWTPVTAWIPPEKALTNLYVEFEGFGVFQPGEAQQGLTATPPGAWYAIRNLRPILNGPPLLSGPAELRATLDELEAAAGKMPGGRVSTLELPKSVDPRRAVVAWGVTPPTGPGLRAELLSEPPDAVRIESTLPWPNRALDAQDVQLGGQAVPAYFTGDGCSLVALLPRPLDTSADLVVSARLRNGRIFKQVFRPRQAAEAAAASNTPPVLLSMRVERGFYQGFEGRSPLLAASHQRSQPPRLMGDAAYPFGSFLRIANNGAPGRLQASLAPGLIDLGSTPLVQFRYRRGGPLPCVSLQAIGYGTAAFAEPFPQAVPVRFASPPPALEPDLADPPGEPRESWRTWMGMLSDAIAPRPFRNGYAVQPCDLVIGSFASHDQTGLYSFIDVDSVAGGPVVGPELPLVVTPRFADPDGVSAVLFAVVEGPEPWAARPAAPPAANGSPGGAPWFAITNDAPHTPFLGHLQDGVHHFVLAAMDGQGAWSEPTDVPFLLDRRPITVESAVVPTPGVNNGTSLRVTFHTFGGSLPRFETLRVACKGRDIDLSRVQGHAAYSPDGVVFNLDWPSILRREIQASRDGDVLSVEFTNLSDAAGNAPANHTAQIPIDYASDTTPPTVQPPRIGTNFFWHALEIRQPRELVGGVPKSMHVVPIVTNDIPVLELRAVQDAKDASVTRTFPQKPWQPSAHPYLAISVCTIGLPKEPGVPPMTLLFNPQHLPAEAKRPAGNAPFAIPLPAAEGADPPWVVAAGGTGWKSGAWRNLVIDVDAFLRDATGLDEAPPLRDFSIAMPGDASYALRIRAAAVLSAWTPELLFTLNAYDASGIEGVAWEGGSSAELSLRPARMKLPDNVGWIEVRVKDRAGNLAPPRFVPVPPASYTEAENLPPAEPAPLEEP
ncbi:MAG: hypothetical protein ACOX5G_05590 [Kiritimatiellia bacterium]|jgi:hypothetical protein